MRLLEVLRRIHGERLKHQVAQLAADLGHRTAIAVIEQQRSNRALDRERGDPRIDGCERAAADSVADERGEEIRAAFAGLLDNAIARVGKARLFGGIELQKIAALIKKLDRDGDRAAK